MYPKLCTYFRAAVTCFIMLFISSHSVPGVRVGGDGGRVSVGRYKDIGRDRRRIRRRERKRGSEGEIDRVRVSERVRERKRGSEGE
jgi:hypothetical protein